MASAPSANSLFTSNRSIVLFLLFWLAFMSRMLWILVRELCHFMDGSGTQIGGFKVYLQYRFGQWYAWTNGSSVYLLLCLSMTLLVVGAFFHSLLTSMPIEGSLWASWIWIAAPDGGNSAEPGGYGVGMLVSLGGMLIFALLVSMITTGIEEQLWHLRHGSTPVVESNHVVILGFKPMVLVLLRELCLAMESAGGGKIVILSKQPKPEVEREIQGADINLRKSAIIVRSGQLDSKEDLHHVAVPTARRILVLTADDCSREEADSETLNVLLALRSIKLLRQAATVVVECCLVRNQRLFQSLATNHMEVVNIQDFMGQLVVESSHQHGLTNIIKETIGFEGSEFYIAHIEDVDGMTFGELLFAFPETVPVGLVSSGGVRMLPSMDAMLETSDRVVLLAEDVSALPKFVRDGIPEASRKIRQEALEKWKVRGTPISQENTPKQLVVILGWNESIDSIMSELDQILGHQSEVLIYSSLSTEEREDFLQSSQKRRKYWYNNICVTHRQGFLGSRYQLDELPLEEASKIFILAEYGNRTISEVDRQTVAALLQLRDILMERNKSKFDDVVIIPQIRGKNAEEACYSSGLEDCIDSNQLSGRVMASICQTPELCSIFGELLSETGARFCIRGLSEYLRHPLRKSVQLNFNEVMAIAAASGEIAIGWSRPAGHRGWELNPRNRTTKRSWGAQDTVVVVGRAWQRNRLKSAIERVALIPRLRLAQSDSQSDCATPHVFSCFGARQRSRKSRLNTNRSSLLSLSSHYSVDSPRNFPTSCGETDDGDEPIASPGKLDGGMRLLVPPPSPTRRVTPRLKTSSSRRTTQTVPMTPVIREHADRVGTRLSSGGSFASGCIPGGSRASTRKDEVSSLTCVLQGQGDGGEPVSPQKKVCGDRKAYCEPLVSDSDSDAPSGENAVKPLLSVLSARKSPRPPTPSTRHVHVGEALCPEQSIAISERLDSLHQRGHLSDLEWTAAKDRVMRLRTHLNGATPS